MVLYYTILSLVFVVPALVWALYAWRPKPVPIERRKVQDVPLPGSYEPIETPYDGQETAFQAHARQCSICQTDK